MPHRIACPSLAVILNLSLGACEVLDVGADASPTDAFVPPYDAGSGVTDAAPRDAALVDAGVSPPDAARVDASMDDPDAFVPDASADAQVAREIAVLDAPPTWKGSRAGGDCSESYRTTGLAPLGAEKRPLFLYFVGTSGSERDRGAAFDAEAPARVLRALARRGFVALSVEYDNASASMFTDKLPCLYGPANADNILARACALPNVDCDLGIATWGHSQGAVIAHSAANYDTRVRAVWTTGYSGFPSRLPVSRFRTVNAEGDQMNGSVESANRTAGFAWGDACPDDGRDSCLRADGSGWLIVRRDACTATTCDHCWFNKRTCLEDAETLEPAWADLQSTTLFSIEANADWVADTTRRAAP